jgi:hypothetical protein
MASKAAIRGNRRLAKNKPPIVSQQEWEVARQKLLVKEKALTRSRDALAAEWRPMPLLAVDKEYEFDGPKGKVSLRRASTDWRVNEASWFASLSPRLRAACARAARGRSTRRPDTGPLIRTTPAARGAR